MRAAYADPPYIGTAKRFYGTEEVCHMCLLRKLERDFDAWALSASSSSLGQILPLCPDGVRIAAWVKPFAFFKGKVRPAYCWEAVIFKTPRKLDRRPIGAGRDWISCNPFGVTAAERRVKPRIVGRKPELFCFWLFSLLGLRPGDEFVDFFPGSFSVTKAWRKWRRTFSSRSGGVDYA